MVLESLTDADRYLRSIPERERAAALKSLKRLVARHGAAQIVRGALCPPPPKPRYNSREY